MKGYIRAHREYGLTPFPGMLVSFTTEEVGSTLNSRVE
ncbi:hypothetical protein J2S74_004203 [Evansella vedderi]|uniref:Uncharacterized protein n=1 Tax=Evansella vedderi TaxID=38282 RepID=A0ABU0A1C8_9BACI|nr:hypothetical protein [Evansella vedderi]